MQVFCVHKQCNEEKRSKKSIYGRNALFVKYSLLFIQFIYIVCAFNAQPGPLSFSLVCFSLNSFYDKIEYLMILCCVQWAFFSIEASKSFKNYEKTHTLSYKYKECFLQQGSLEYCQMIFVLY